MTLSCFYNILSYSGSSPIMPYLFLCLLFADAKTEFQSCYSLLKTDPQFLTGFYYPLSNSIFFTVLMLASADFSHFLFFIILQRLTLLSPPLSVTTGNCQNTFSGTFVTAAQPLPQSAFLFAYFLTRSTYWLYSLNVRHLSISFIQSEIDVQHEHLQFQLRF